MDLKRKLALLSGPSQRAQAVPGGEVRPPGLEDLRARMAEILGRPLSAPSSAPQSDPAETTLPFSRVPTPSGDITQRIDRVAGGVAVGRMPVSAARDAAGAHLALLALDPALADVSLERALYLDTETTGLGGGAGTLAFLLGLAYFEGGVLYTEQLLLRSPAEEHAMLEVLRARIDGCSCLVSFNGKSFDWPLLAGRYAMNQLEPPMRRPHLDLLHVGRRVHKLRIGSCTLKALEREVLGFERDGDIDGAEVAPRYGHFLRSGDEESLRAVVDHNLWDVLTMVALVGLYGEPLDLLHEQDLLGVASTLKRAKEFDEAARAAQRSLDRGGGAAARRMQGVIAKARGDRAQALADFEAVHEEIDDPAVRLELAKLYEHYVKRPVEALRLARGGTGESASALQRRLRRLEKKARRSGES